MGTPVENFGLVTVSTGYGAGATSVVLSTGDGSRLPDSFPYPMTWWNATDYAAPADDPNREIVSVTNRSTDTLTIARAQENTSASGKDTAGKTYRMSLGITKAMWEDLRVVKGMHDGIVLQTNRNASLATSQVELVTCNYIVMDDGVALRNDNNEWAGKTANIALSGAGGLDAGTEEGAAWYEVLAIAKEDGTRDLMLHRSKEWLTDDFNTSGEDASQNIRSTSSNQSVSQGFMTFDSGRLLAVRVKVKKVGSPTGQITCTVYANSAGVPGSLLLTAYTLDVSRLPTTASNIVFLFPLTASPLSSATQYHLVLSGTWAINGTDYVEWRMDGSAGTYANGAKALFNGTSWSVDTDDDMIFSLYVEKYVSAATLPTDYTKQCLLGWVYNDGGSDFIPFIQHGRTRRTANISTDNSRLFTLTGGIDHADMEYMTPPLVACTVEIGVGGTGTQAAVLAVGDARATDISSSGETTAAQAVVYSGTTSLRPCGFAQVIVERGHVMLQGTAGARVWVIGFSW